MDGLERVTFRFGSDTQVHYLARTPEPGDLVSHDGELWVVASIDEDPVGMLVVCEQAERSAQTSADE